MRTIISFLLKTRPLMRRKRKAFISFKFSDGTVFAMPAKKKVLFKKKENPEIMG
jgi:hypothetical protein